MNRYKDLFFSSKAYFDSKGIPSDEAFIQWKIQQINVIFETKYFFSRQFFFMAPQWLNEPFPTWKESSFD